jgi:hypothetical protein
MKRQQLLDKLDKAWLDLCDSYAGLSHEEMTQPGVTEGWSVKDILAHVTTWEEEAITHLPHILEGTRPPRYSTLYGGIDAFNALRAGEKRALPPEEVLRQFEDVHRQLVEYIAQAPEEQFTTETRFRRRIRLDTYSHYPHHAQAIREWRAQAGI